MKKYNGSSWTLIVALLFWAIVIGVAFLITK